MQMDANGDGKLAKAELGETRLVAVFDRIDTDGDGFATGEELTTFMAARGGRGGAMRGGDRAAGRPAGRPGNAETAQEATKPSGPSRDGFDEAMSRAGRALRGLRRTKFAADTFERDFMALLELETSLMEARRNVSAVPMSEAAKARFGSDQSAYQRSFQRHMAEALMATLKVEMAVLDGDAAKAKELMTGILENRNESHDLFEQ